MKDRAELIEVMARATFAHANGTEEWRWKISERKGHWREHAEVALTAIEAAGAVVMPKEAPMGTLIAGCQAFNTSDAKDEIMTAHLTPGPHEIARAKMRLRYAAMLATIPFVTK